LGSTFDVFRRAERVETLAAAVYAAVARHFRADANAHALFRRLEGEELQHAARVRLLAATYRNDSKLIEKVNGAETLDACLRYAEEALAQVEAGEWGPGISDVFARLARLEERLQSAHAHLLALNADTKLRDFFEELAHMDDAHVVLLR
jgi:hypothetical protein